jgi:ubiquinone/menaquinone biosynthesis C-methylase UbiE
VIPWPGIELRYDDNLSSLEKLYVRLFGVPINGLRIRLRRILPHTRGPYKKILDAGCGRGVFSMEMAKRHPDASIVGIDLEQELVDRANNIVKAAQLSNCSFVQSNVVTLPFENEFDMILSVDNMEHVEDDIGAMTSIFNALKPEGTLVMHVPGYFRRYPVFKKSTNFDVPGHVRPGYTIEQLSEKLEKVGFQIHAKQYTYGFLETLTNNISYMITGAAMKRKKFYALVFPILNVLSYFGQFSQPNWGAGVLVKASKPAKSPQPKP